MTTKKKTTGLGRGLGSILPDVDIDAAMGKGNLTTAITTIPLDSIEANPFQPRKEFDQQALEELAQSIKQQGVITPITVRQMPDGKYQLIAGERRLKASKMAGLKDIPAYIRIATDTQMMEMALVENIQRENLNAMEIAFSYNALIEECQLTHEQLSEKVGKNRSTITNYLRLLNLPSETQLALGSEQISMAHARCLVNVEDTETHLALLHDIINKQLSVRQTEQLVKELSKPKAPVVQRKKEDLPETHAASRSALKQYLQSEVDIKRSRRGKGTLTIHFNSDKDFERIIKLISE
ncbi:MAG: ParB/RepB/Spo0J family partition protein [Bacteroidales bacterium]|nr:ParB/RepB/Spo0J family partition protein [Bacteroidales bacterium]MBR4176381.1 ParB/RepB/Spo0J family partition protein [Bacteroidales bacterium]MBR4715643.1 ParB/RepB/Spo0J family partition protein [Bacteroidales bacterium]